MACVALRGAFTIACLDDTTLGLVRLSGGGGGGGGGGISGCELRSVRLDPAGSGSMDPAGGSGSTVVVAGAAVAATGDLGRSQVISGDPVSLSVGGGYVLAIFGDGHTRCVASAPGDSGHSGHSGHRGFGLGGGGGNSGLGPPLASVGSALALPLPAGALLQHVVLGDFHGATPRRPRATSVSVPPLHALCTRSARALHLHCTRLHLSASSPHLLCSLSAHSLDHSLHLSLAPIAAPLPHSLQAWLAFSSRPTTGRRRDRPPHTPASMPRPGPTPRPTPRFSCTRRQARGPQPRAVQPPQPRQLPKLMKPLKPL